MASPVTSDLLIAFTTLASLILLIMLVFFIVRYIRQHQALQNSNNTLEAGQQAPEDSPIPHCSRRLDHFPEQQRVSTVSPVLPEINTSDDQTDEWLERGNLAEDKKRE